MNHAYKVQRGRILKILDKAFPDEVASSVMALTLQEMHLAATIGQIRGHCEYLAGKGYVEIKHEDVKSDFTVTITPKGIDLLEENIPADPGIWV